MPAIKVSITTDATIARAALLKLIESNQNFQVAGQSNTKELLPHLTRAKPEVLLFHVDPDDPQLELIRHIRQQVETAVVVLGRRRDKAFVRAVMAAGAHAYVLLQGEPDTLYAALRAASQHRRYIDPELSEAVVDVLLGKESDPHVRLMDQLLSVREQQVLRLLAFGHTHQRIAEQIGVSTKTVETYRLRIAEKLDLRSRAEIISFALVVGILSGNSAA